MKLWRDSGKFHHSLQLGLGLYHSSQVFVRNQFFALVSERKVGRGLLDLQVCNELLHDVSYHQSWVNPDFDDAILGCNTVCWDERFGTAVSSGTLTKGVTIGVRGHVIEPTERERENEVAKCQGSARTGVSGIRGQSSTKKKFNCPNVPPITAIQIRFHMIDPLVHHSFIQYALTTRSTFTGPVGAYNDYL